MKTYAEYFDSKIIVCLGGSSFSKTQFASSNKSTIFPISIYIHIHIIWYQPRQQSKQFLLEIEDMKSIVKSISMELDERLSNTMKQILIEIEKMKSIVKSIFVELHERLRKIEERWRVSESKSNSHQATKISNISLKIWWP